MAKQTSKSNWVWVLLAAGILALMFIRIGGRHSPSGIEHPAVGEAFPELRVNGLTGVEGSPPAGQLSLRDLHGQVVLLNFWGPWCPYCLDELPGLVEIDEQFRANSNFKFIAVSYPNQQTDFDQLQSDTQSCLDRLGLKMPSYIDEVGLTSGSLGYLLGTPNHGFPATLVLDQKGIVRGVWLGYHATAIEQMRQLIDELLKASSTAVPTSEAVPSQTQSPQSE